MQAALHSHWKPRTLFSPGSLITLCLPAWAHGEHYRYPALHSPLYPSPPRLSISDDERPKRTTIAFANLSWSPRLPVSDI